MHLWHLSTTSFIISTVKLITKSRRQPFLIWTHPNVTASKIIMHEPTCMITMTDADDCRHLCSVIHDLPSSRHPHSGIVLFMDERVGFLSFLFFFFPRFKAFCPLVHLSLMRSACSISLQHPPMHFREFDTFCPQNAYYDTLLLDGSIVGRSVHTSDLIAPFLSTESWN